MIPNSSFTNYTGPAFIQGATPTPRGRGRGATTGAKRGRKPRGSLPNANVDPRPLSQPGPSTSQPTTVQWAQPITQIPRSSGPSDTPTQGVISTAEQSQGTTVATSTQSQGTLLSLPSTIPVLPAGAGGTLQRPSGPGVADEDGDGEDELLPAMADDDFAAQSSWNSQSKDNLKCAIHFIHKVITLNDLMFGTGYLWTTSVQHNMSALKRIVDMHCPNRPSGRHDIIPSIAVFLVSNGFPGDSTVTRSASFATGCANCSRIC